MNFTKRLEKLALFFISFLQVHVSSPVFPRNKFAYPHAKYHSFIRIPIIIMVQKSPKIIIFISNKILNSQIIIITEKSSIRFLSSNYSVYIFYHS